MILEVGAQAPAFYLFNWAVDLLLLNCCRTRAKSRGSAQPLRSIVGVRQLLSSHALLFGLDSKRRALRARRLLSIAVLEGLVFSVIEVCAGSPPADDPHPRPPVLGGFVELLDLRKNKGRPMDGPCIGFSNLRYFDDSTSSRSAPALVEVGFSAE